MISVKGNSCAWLSVLFGLFMALSAQAQTASQITPQSYRPRLQALNGAIVVPEEQGLDVPEGADGLSVHVGQVLIEGGPVSMRRQASAIASRLNDRTVTVAAVFRTARELESAYARAGYVLVRVVLPPQSLKDGENVRLVVIDGFIERLDTSGLAPQIRDSVEQSLAPLVGKHGLHLSEIERRILLAGDTPGVTLKSALGSGDQAGGSVLIIQSQYKARDISLDLDNGLSSDLGIYTAGVGYLLNSTLGGGELIYLRAGGYPGTGDDGLTDVLSLDRSLVTGVVLPLGHNGFSFTAEAVDARVTPRHDPTSLGVTSDFGRLSFGIHYAAARSRRLNINAEVRFDAQQEKLDAVYPAKAGLSLDRTRVIRLTGDIAAATPDGVSISARLTTSFGLSGLGARTQADATPLLPLSRQGADARFHKLEVDVYYDKPLAAGVDWTIHVRGQTSFKKPLLNSERMSMAGASGLSSFDSGLVQGDTGYVARSEFRLSPRGWVSADGSIFAPYVFAALGNVITEKPTALERHSISGVSYGFGVKVVSVLPNKTGQSQTSLEWAGGKRSDARKSENRINLVTRAMF